MHKKKKFFGTDGLRIDRGDEVPVLPVMWLWYRFLAVNEINIIAGPSSIGKTTIAISVAAAVTRGGQLPDGAYAPMGSVLVWSGEDSIEHTLAARFIAAGADMSKVFFIREAYENGNERPFDFQRDHERLVAHLEAHRDIKVVLIDPIVSVVKGNVNSNQAVRAGLEPLRALAEQYGVAIIGITHTTKGSAKKKPLEQMTGSFAFGAVARVVIIVAKDKSLPGNSKRGVIVLAKTNNAPEDGGFGYEIQEATVPTENRLFAARTSFIGWYPEMIQGTNEEILARASDQIKTGNPSAVEVAKEFLIQLLRDGPMLRNHVYTAAEQEEISYKSLEKAKRELGVISKKTRQDTDEMRSMWSLPQDFTRGMTQQHTTGPLFPAVWGAVVGSGGDLEISRPYFAVQVGQQGQVVQPGHVGVIGSLGQQPVRQMELWLVNGYNECASECRRYYQGLARKPNEPEQDFVIRVVEQSMSKNFNDTDEEKKMNDHIRDLLLRNAPQWPDCPIPYGLI